MKTPDLKQGLFSRVIVSLTIIWRKSPFLDDSFKDDVAIALMFESYYKDIKQ